MSKSLPSCLLFASLTLWASVGAAVDLVLLDRVEPSGGVIRLSDVAAILNAGPEEIERLGSLPLMPSPPLGTEQTITAQGIRELLDAHGRDLSNLRFRGAHSVRVARPGSIAGVTKAPAPTTGFRVAAGANPTKSPSRPAAPRTVRISNHRREQTVEQLAQKLSQYVQAQTGDAMLYVMQVELKDHNAAMLAASKSELRIDADASLSCGPQRFQVAFDSPEGEVKFPVFANVVEARPAVIARRDVPRGMSITAADVHLAPLPLDYRSRGMEMVAQSIDEVIGKEAARSIRPGEVITDGNSLPPLMVERGELVTVTAGSGAIHVRTRAKALRPGRYGEFIELESLDSHERYDARVVGRGRLAVLSAGGAAAQSVANRVEPMRTR